MNSIYKIHAKYIDLAYTITAVIILLFLYTRIGDGTVPGYFLIAFLPTIMTAFVLTESDYPELQRSLLMLPILIFCTFWMYCAQELDGGSFVYAVVLTAFYILGVLVIHSVRLQIFNICVQIAVAIYYGWSAGFYNTLAGLTFEVLLILTITMANLDFEREKGYRHLPTAFYRMFGGFLGILIFLLRLYEDCSGKINPYTAEINQSAFYLELASCLAGCLAGAFLILKRDKLFQTAAVCCLAARIFLNVCYYNLFFVKEMILTASSFLVILSMSANLKRFKAMRILFTAAKVILICAVFLLPVHSYDTGIYLIFRMANCFLLYVATADPESYNRILSIPIDVNENCESDTIAEPESIEFNGRSWFVFNVGGNEDASRSYYILASRNDRSSYDVMLKKDTEDGEHMASLESDDEVESAVHLFLRN